MTPERICSNCGERYPPDVIYCPRDGLPLFSGTAGPERDAYLGLTILGQIRLEQLIGVGAMGRVYRAHQSGIERSVAVKILHRELLQNATVILRFHREAKLMSRLAHPNIVQVLMSGELSAAGPDVGGEAYLVTEYLDGISLRSALAAAAGPLPLARALHVLLQVADAVGEVHAQGIVHRDLKPENVMLVRRGDDADFVKVLDFGVARVQSPEPTVATQAGVIFGTARYISPEGAQGNPVTPESDVYSLAVILFQCLAGRTPFEADSAVKLLIQHTSTSAPDLRSLPGASDVPEPIARVIAVNLSKNPSDRAKNGRELAQALLGAAREAGLSLGQKQATLKLATVDRTEAAGVPPELGRPDIEAPLETGEPVDLPLGRGPLSVLVWLGIALLAIAFTMYLLGVFGSAAGGG